MVFGLDMRFLGRNGKRKNVLDKSFSLGALEGDEKSASTWKDSIRTEQGCRRKMMIAAYEKKARG
jgi:hypothetical protein